MDDFFNFLTNSINSIRGPLILGCDFNTVKEAEEKIGVALNLRYMRKFGDFIQYNNLIDVPVAGSPFTWCGGYGKAIACKLDMFLVSAEVVGQFPNIVQRTRPRGLSDHRHVLLSLPSVVSGPKSFKCFSYWVDKLELADLIRSVVSESGNVGASCTLRAIKSAVKD
ncbi:hypothetical protein V6N12_044922 [Hibiscus sabdariffa]|uniref:Endonuclease/exonuclease/phosphatase domain-containing protein n=1 Tax=Hibiscus sabdariffa TaxID=183260 RepID=A0ABR2G1F9_9ROSI